MVQTNLVTVLFCYPLHVPLKIKNTVLSMDQSFKRCALLRNVYPRELGKGKLLALFLRTVCVKMIMIYAIPASLVVLSAALA
jgi:hypothetical protein